MVFFVDLQNTTLVIITNCLNAFQELCGYQECALPFTDPPRTTDVYQTMPDYIIRLSYSLDAALSILIIYEVPGRLPPRNQLNSTRLAVGRTDFLVAILRSDALHRN